MQAGKLIQNYRLLRFIGDGGMGSVWLAEHTLLGRQVAIKSLHSQLLRNQGIRERFKHEAATLAHLQHPGIVAMHDYIEDDEGAYLVMEFVEGMPLDDYIKEVSGPIPEPQLRAFFAQILDGFAYAHEKRIVHRDIKPGNFLVTPEGKVKILDFGIAKILGDGDRKLTKTGTHMGTVLYMSPEQVTGKTIDQRSDIYSLGITLFQMATGQNPYSADMTEFYVYDQIVNHPVPPAHEFYPGVSTEIEALIAKATAKAPEDRFQDIAAFSEALANGLPAEVAKPELPTDVPNALVAQPAEPASEELKQAPLAVIATPVNAPEKAPEPQTVVAANAPIPPKRPRRWPWVIALLMLVGMTGAMAIYFRNSLKFEPQKDGKYVIASSLFLREAPNDNAPFKEKIPYGTQVDVKGPAKQGWVELKHKGKSVFVAENYLVDYNDFLVLDHLCANEAAKEMLRESTDKLALRAYFQDNRLRVDLPKAEYQSVYGEDPDPKRIWYVKAESKNRAYNTVIQEIKLEKGYWMAKEKKNSVVILENKADPTQHRLVAFRHVKKSNGNVESMAIGSRDLNDCPKCLLRAVDWDDIGNYQIPNFDELLSVYKAINKSKQGILLSTGAFDPAPTLLLWEGLNKFKAYPLVLGPRD